MKDNLDTYRDIYREVFYQALSYYQAPKQRWQNEPAEVIAWADVEKINEKDLEKIYKKMKKEESERSNSHK